jgi:hypothetical protein
VVLDSDVDRNEGIVRLSSVGNLAPHSNKCHIFSNIFYVLELTSFTIAPFLSGPYAFEPSEG